MSYLAVDIGGTKTLIVAFSAEGKIKESRKFETPALYETFIEELAANVAKLSTKKFIGGAVAVPGRINRDEGKIVSLGNLTWRHVSIQKDISRISSCPIVIENDANLAGLSEARNVPKYRRVLYVTISTGIGGGYIINGHIDPNTKDSEIGQVLLEHNGALRRWEEFASGRAIVGQFGKRASEIDPNDGGAWYTIGRNIAIGLIDAIAILAPEVVIMGGGVGAHFKNFETHLIEALKIYENSLMKIPPIIQAKHPEEAVVYGCFELAKEEYGKTT